MVNLSGQRGVPVVLIDGQVVIGFNRPRIDQLLADRGARRPRLGASVADAQTIAQREGSGPTEGAYVGSVKPMTPGDKAGLAEGDVIVALAGAPIRGAEDLEATLAKLVPGKTVPLVYVREGQRITANIEP
jgi:serine protease Do